MKYRRTGLIALGIAALLALSLDTASLYGAARYALDRPLSLLAAFAAYTAAFGLRALSWRQLLRERVSFGKLFAFIMGALFLNHAAPTKAGDIARMYALSRRGVAGERAVARGVGVKIAVITHAIKFLYALAGAPFVASLPGAKRP